MLVEGAERSGEVVMEVEAASGERGDSLSFFLAFALSFTLFSFFPLFLFILYPLS